MVGLEFTLNDGSKDWYDPLNYEDDFKEDNDVYSFTLANNYTYTLNKSDVKSIRIYQLCEECGYELVSHKCTNDCCDSNQTN